MVPSPWMMGWEGPFSMGGGLTKQIFFFGGGEVGTSHRGSGQRVCLFCDFQATVKGRPLGVY